MTLGSTLVVAGLALLAVMLMIVWPQLRRRWQPAHTLKPAHRRTLLRGLPWAGAVDSSRRERLFASAGRLLDEVDIVGADGLVLSDRQRLLIAGQAALLSLGAQPLAAKLPGEIVVYPGPIDRASDAVGLQGVVEDLTDLAVGADSIGHRVAISWPAVEAALNGARQNPLVRALAHPQIFNDIDHDIPTVAQSDSWAAALHAQRLALDTHDDALLVFPADTSTERFLSIAAEAFFQQPVALHQAHPALYALLAAYFDLDLAKRPPRFAPQKAVA